MCDLLSSLEAGFDKYGVEVEMQRRLRDVHDNAIRVTDRVDSYRALLQNALTVHTTLVGQQQNEEMKSLTEASLAQNEEVKRISSWAAIFFAPSLIGTIYGMNFTHMPNWNGPTGIHSRSPQWSWRRSCSTWPSSAAAGPRQNRWLGLKHDESDHGRCQHRC